MTYSNKRVTFYLSENKSMRNLEIHSYFKMICYTTNSVPELNSEVTETQQVTVPELSGCEENTSSFYPRKVLSFPTEKSDSVYFCCLIKKSHSPPSSSMFKIILV